MASEGEAPDRSGTPATRGAAWRIVTRVESEGERPVYDVYRGRERLAWGLLDRAAAQRWIVRLGGTPSSDVETSTSAPRRAWWGEKD